MSNNTSALITNNIISVLIHIFICLILAPPILIIHIGLPGGFWVAMIPYTIIVFGLYLFAGRLFLRNTKNMLSDTCSLILLALMFFINVAYFWDGGAIELLFLPLYQLGEPISYIFQLADGSNERKYIYMILSPLLPLSVWAGLRAKRYVEAFQSQQQQSTLKNRLLLILSKKKQSSILFIALICSAYLSLVIIFIIMFIMYEIGFY